MLHLKKSNLRIKRLQGIKLQNFKVKTASDPVYLTLILVLSDPVFIFKMLVFCASWIFWPSF